MKIYRGKKSY